MTPAPLTPRRAKRIEARRAQILDAAAGIFAAKGYQGATTREIAEAADIAEGTIYNYFTTKSDLLVALINEQAGASQIPALLAAYRDLPLRAVFKRIVAFRLARNQPYMAALFRLLPEILVVPELRVVYHDRIVKPLMDAIEAHLHERQARGEIKPVDLALLARVIASALIGLAIFQMVGDEAAQTLWQNPQSLQDMLEQIFFDGVINEATRPPAED